MILVSGSDTFQLQPLMLSEPERRMMRAKQRSSVIYRYPSTEALVFEQKMRSQIVEAAKAMNASGVNFATFDTSKCNVRYWMRTENGGFQLRRGVLPSVGINDVFYNGPLYGFECAVAIIIMLYKATLDTIGEEVFNAYFQSLYLRSWQYDRDMPLIMTYNKYEAYPGDVLYFKNPAYNPATPEWQGENVIMLDDNLYFGHGIGIGSGQQMIAALNRMRAPGSMRSAYLDDIVVTPEFEYLRRISMRDDVWESQAYDEPYAVVGRIGASKIIYR